MLLATKTRDASHDGQVDWCEIVAATKSCWNGNVAVRPKFSTLRSIFNELAHAVVTGRFVVKIRTDLSIAVAQLIKLLRTLCSGSEDVVEYLDPLQLPSQ